MSNAEKLLVEKLKPLLSPLGFKWVRAREIYIRQEEYGFSSFCWASHSTHEEGGRLEITPILGVRHHVIEDVVNQLGLIYGDENKRYTTTVEQGLGYFPLQAGKTYMQYVRLASFEFDVMQTATALAGILGVEGSEFFERYSSLLACSQGLNDQIESKSHPLCNNFPRRAYYGITAAWFAEKERVPDLTDRYLRFAKETLPSQYEQIEKKVGQLISILKSTQSESM